MSNDCPRPAWTISWYRFSVGEGVGGAHDGLKAVSAMTRKALQEALRLLSSENRRKILVELGQRSATAREIGQSIGVSTSTARQNLQVLRDHRLLLAKRRGRSLSYSLAPTASVSYAPGEVRLTIEVDRVRFQRRLFDVASVLEDVGLGARIVARQPSPRGGSR